MVDFSEQKNLLDVSKLDYDTIITSTSAKADHEVQFLKIAKLSGIRTISILDHWVNYASRFLRNGEYIFPDEIWVTDNEAREIANASFENLKVTQIENPYKVYLQNRYLPRSKPHRGTVLYCTEPIKSFNNTSQDRQNINYDEFVALESFIQKIAANKL